MSKQLNKNLQSLRAYESKTSQGAQATAAIEYQEKMAGMANPETADPVGMAQSFSTKKSKSVNQARSRISFIVKAAKSKRGTVRKLTGSEKQRIKSLSETVFGKQTVTRRRKVYDEPKTGNAKKDKKRKYHYVEYETEVLAHQFTQNEMNDIIELLQDKNMPGYDSDQIVKAFGLEKGDSVFENTDDLKEFIREKIQTGEMLRELENAHTEKMKRESSKIYNMKHSYKKNEKTGEWELVIRLR